MGRIVGTDGVRGVANEHLTPELAVALGRALVTVLADEGEKRPSIVVGRDPRWSGEMLESALVAGITSAGGDAVAVGVLPTPAVAYLTSRSSAAAGAMISASHNPVGDNGIKFFGPDGFKLTDQEEDRLEDEADDAVGSAWSDLGTGDLYGDGLSLPEAHVLLGLVIIVLAALRLVWRRTTPLPPWAERLSSQGRRRLHLTEVSLLVLLLVVPATGVLLVTGYDDLVGLHIAAHVAFFVALAAHLAVVLGNGLLPRMLPWGRVRNPTAGAASDRAASPWRS